MGALEHRREVGFLPGCRPSAFMVVLYFPAVFSGIHSFLQTGFHVKPPSTRYLARILLRFLVRKAPNAPWAASYQIPF
jgi:hypothetical protein